MTPEQKMALEWLREQRNYLADRLTDYESGTWEIGRIEGGVKVDETQNVIDDLRRRIAELDRMITAYEAGK